MFLSVTDYLALPRDPNPWVIKDLIPVGGLINIYGKPKTGKSYGALGMAHAVSSGQPRWLNFNVRKHGPVAVLEIDTPRGEWASRLRRIERAGLDMSNVYIADMLMLPSYPFNIIDQDQFKWLQDALAKLQPVLVFIDTLREAHGGDENDSTVMRNVVTSIVAACRPAAVGFISHARKDNMFTAAGGDDLMNDARGSSYVSGRMDTVLKFGATTMAYKGRSKGQGTLTIEQNEDHGLIQLNAASAAYVELLQGLTNTLRGEDPTVSIRTIAKTISEHTDYRKLRTIQDDVKDYLTVQATEEDDD